METFKILSADVLDLIFDKRNKSYGAYQLRKEYNSRINIAFIGMLTLATILSLLSFIHHNPPKSAEIFSTVLDPVLKQPPLEPLKKVVVNQHQNLKSITATHPPFIVKNLPPVKPFPEPNEADVQGTPGGTETAMVGITSNAIDSATNIKPAPEKKVETPGDIPISDPEVMPQFPGGMGALAKFLQNNLKSPEDLEENESRDVRITFIVDYKGNLSGFDISKSGGIHFDNEVIRVLKRMPKWNPGKSHDQNVSVYFTLPVKFTSTL